MYAVDNFCSVGVSQFSTHVSTEQQADVHRTFFPLSIAVQCSESGTKVCRHISLFL